MNSRYHGPKTKSTRKMLIQANTVLLAFCALVMALEIALLVLSRESNPTAMTIEEKIAPYLYSITVQALFAAIAITSSILQFVLTNDKCGKSCQCHIFVTLE